MKDAFGAIFFASPFRTEERMRGEESADLRFDDSTVCQILAAAAGSLSKMSPASRSPISSRENVNVPRFSPNAGTSRSPC